MSDKRILVIRTGGLGDTLLLWPALVALRRRFPMAQIDLMGHPDRLGLLVAENGADRALDVEGSGLHTMYETSSTPSKTVRERFGGYDLIVVFAASGDYALAENLSICGVDEVHAFLTFPQSQDRVHVAEYAKRAFLEADIGLEGQDPLLPVSTKELEHARKMLEKLGCSNQKLAVLAPGSGSVAKNWPIEKYAELGLELQARSWMPLFLQGPAEQRWMENWFAKVQGWPFLLLKDADLPLLKGVLSLASMMVGNDSGPTHLAGLLGVFTVALFGPTDSACFRPWGPRVRVVQSDLDCAPCSLEERQACRERECLVKLSLEAVKDACCETLIT